MSPYEVKKVKGARPWKIVRTDTGKIVGSSITKSDALKSIAYRERAKKEGSIKPITNKQRSVDKSKKTKIWIKKQKNF